MSDGLKIATIGGGSSYTPELIEGFINRISTLPVSDIYLVDIEEGKEKLEIVAGLAERMVKRAGVNIKIQPTLNRREAIEGADFVTTQFRVGLLDARARDERIPLKYGCIGQETTGAGGFAKALRTIPVILDICRDIEELSPDAWLINFTNPSGIITETVLKHTKVKCIGLCNVPITMRYGIADVLGVEADRIYIEYVGLNHLVWGRRVYLDGKDITEMLIEGIANRDLPEFPYEKEFLKSLKMIPCPYHRYYYNTDEMLKEELEAAEGEGTRAEVVKKIEKDLFEKYKDTNLDVKPEELSKRGGAHYSEAACMLIESIYTDKKDIQPVNTLNNGAISDLPDNVVIETNCVIDSQGAHPINIGHIPQEIRGLIQVVKAYEELTIEAGVYGDYDRALQALAIHPLVKSAKKARMILEDILKENRDYLPQFVERLS